MKIRQKNMFMKFPFSIDADGVKVADRAEHIRNDIEQLLFTGPGERVLRPEYGVGVKKLVFEPNGSYLCKITQKRIHAALADLLHGEAAPESIDVLVTAEDEKLFINISYVLAAVDLKQSFSFPAEITDTVSAKETPAKKWDFSEHDDSAKNDIPSLKLDFYQDAKGRWSGRRTVENLPDKLPVCNDDFDWKQRDWDSLRFAMLSDLKQSFPERSNWSVSDLESVLVELLSFGLDMLSDKTDRIMNESFLETASDPDRVQLLTRFIGYNIFKHIPNGALKIKDSVENTEEENLKAAVNFWRESPYYMNLTRIHAPASTVSQDRMVTVQDYNTRLSEHPVVKQSLISIAWDGSSEVVYISFILSAGLFLDTFLNTHEISEELIKEIEQFHRSLDLSSKTWGICWMPDVEDGVTPRMLLERYINLYRMAGQTVIMTDAAEVGIDLQLTVTIKNNFYCSEVMYEVKNIMSSEQGGFFEPGMLLFGEDINIGDIMEWIMSISGVANVLLNTLKRSGNWPDVSTSGAIVLKENEYAVIKNLADEPLRGSLTLKFKGGIRG